MSLKENPEQIQLKDVPGISLWDAHPFLARESLAQETERSNKVGT